MVVFIVRLALVLVLVSGCSGLPPAAADRPQLWASVANYSTDVAWVMFEGETGGHVTSASVDVPSCFHGAWNFPLEESWRLTVNGQPLAEAAPFIQPDSDLVAVIEIADTAAISLVSLNAGERPRDAGVIC